MHITRARNGRQHEHCQGSNLPSVTGQQKLQIFTWAHGAYYSSEASTYIYIYIYVCVCVCVCDEPSKNR
jgi:hypothetical protein